MQMRILKTVLCLLFACIYMHAQKSGQPGSESLYAVFKDAGLPDSVRLQSMHDLIWDHFIISKPDSALLLADEFLDLAVKSSNNYFIADAYNTLANAHINKCAYTSFRGNSTLMKGAL